MGEAITDSVDTKQIRASLDRGDILAEHVIVGALSRLEAILLTEDTILHVQSPVVICGDVHGQYEDVKALFTAAEADPRKTKFIFMGDYVDRGYYSLNTFLLLATYKLNNPNGIILLRGNHESRQVTHQYGFYLEIVSSYGHPGIWNVCMRIFDLLPYASVTDKRIFSVHGGLSPDLRVIDGLMQVDRYHEIPDAGLLADVTWSDPEDGRPVEWQPNRRGAGFIFGEKPVAKFCHWNNIKLVTRSHQIVMEGFKWFFPNRATTFPGQLINVWSAPNYCYQSGNKASVLKLGFDGEESIELPVFVEAKERIDKDNRAVSLDYFA
jgi:diadenosine tetraphosphatase ApaH/serine/threonine PP2A family protein phosphatase